MTTLTWADTCAWWARHDGLDGGVRVLGAVTVVVTIEALAGYFLWVGMTLQVGVPDALGWTLQAGLAGGSAVGTRAFHRGQVEDRWWGLAASVLAVAFLVVDAAVFALLAHDQIAVEAGSLAVVVLAQCLVVGYLTVHTLMARPRTVGVPAAPQCPSSPGSRTSPPSALPETSTGWGPPATVTAPVPTVPVPTARKDPPRPDPAPLRSVPARRSPGVPTVPGWTKRTARARCAELGIPQGGQVAQLVARIEATETARAVPAGAAS